MTMTPIRWCSAAVAAAGFFVVATPGPARLLGSPKQAVRVDSISPTAAHRGEQVTVKGENFGGPNVRIAVSGVPAPLVSATGSVASFRVPASAPFGRDTVRVMEPGGTSATIGLEVDYDGKATIVTDDARAVGADIGPAGGSLTSGRLRLVVPAGALPETVRITMTPLTSISGTPFDGSLIVAISSSAA
jgi:hypothetical protein